VAPGLTVPAPLGGSGSNNHNRFERFTVSKPAALPQDTYYVVNHTQAKKEEGQEQGVAYRSELCWLTRLSKKIISEKRAIENKGLLLPKFL
jgi:hypothetical protein